MRPILFNIGPFPVHAYGLLLAAGFITALTVAARRASRRGLSADSIQSLGLTALLCGILGARAAYVGLNWDFFRWALWEIPRLDHGGLVFYGGLIGGALGVLWKIWRLKLPLGMTLDLLTPALALGHAFGRVGCFLNGCCYGKPTDGPWGMVFFHGDSPRHPTQLYEMTALIVLFLFLSRLEGRPHRPGSVFWSYGLLYGAWRFGIEFLRGDNPIWSGLTSFQWISIPLMGLSAAALLWLRRREPAADGRSGTHPKDRS
ncbi:MAG: prolipoprotein diacylglyceryl transferase [Candidatus Omnitrophica bacterium CG11_big_fil_rev_8_21_14_0_20_64_10]|nr:MAG: prolipoprotein diacylglyceryl transferase [Candidatus Omnitrophica bacterium CG11_big_fil_rev_8_21_14_0_20_64_10]